MYKGQTITVIIPCLNEEQGIERVLNRMPDFVDETIVVGAVSMASRRFRFETDESKDAITIWLAPEQNWAPARLLLSTPDGMLTFDAISIRHGADESGQKRVSPAK